LEADGLATRVEAAAARLRDTAARLDSYVDLLRRPPREGAYVPHADVAHDVLADVITAIANLALPGIMRSAATADVYLTQERGQS
jgi:hypothetical protein